MNDNNLIQALLDIKENVGNLSSSISALQKEVADLKTQLSDKYVTRDEFKPVKNLVYGCVTLILVAVVGALIKLVVIDGAK
jgi:hypothetical protein